MTGFSLNYMQHISQVFFLLLCKVRLLISSDKYSHTLIWGEIQGLRIKPTSGLVKTALQEHFLAHICISNQGTAQCSAVRICVRVTL